MEVKGILYQIMNGQWQIFMLIYWALKKQRDKNGKRNKLSKDEKETFGDL